jgi:hypothetical protein
VTAATRRVALTAAVIGSTAAIVWEGTYGAFTATTKNSGNSVTAGTVIINQHTGASTMFNVTTPSRATASRNASASSPSSTSPSSAAPA